MLIKNARYYDAGFELAFGDIRVDNDTISEIGTGLSGDMSIIDAKDCIVVPGLVDVHIHGCHGVDTGDGNASAITRMSKFLASRGVTAFLPTAMSDTAEHQEIQAAAVKKAMEMPYGARILGLRAEGPFLSPERPGAHPVELLREPSITEANALNEACGGNLKIIDLAPELNNSAEFIGQALEKGYIISLAHSDADYDTAINAFKMGVNDVTHLYNAMSPLKHREPGVVGAAFDTKYTPFCEIISDGHHIHPAAVRCAARLIGFDRLVIISDSCPATGMPDGNYCLGRVPITVKDGVARNAEGALSGSTATVMDCMFRMTRMGISFENALRAASINPARLLKMDSLIGSIAVGKKADLVLLNSSDYAVKRVIIGGRPFNRGLI